jgi:ATP-dependent Lon protease
MSEKPSILKKEINKSPNDLVVLVEKKIDFFKDVIQKTIINIQKNKVLDILGVGDVSTCIEKLGELSDKLKELDELKKTNQENLINGLQLVNNELSGILKNYGTDSLEDLLLICFGNNNKFVYNENGLENDKFALLKKYFHPTSYKIISKKDDKQKKNEEIIEDDKIPNLACYDTSNVFKQFHMKVYGIKIYIYNENLKKNLVIFGVLDDVVVSYLNSKFIITKKHDLLKNLPNDKDFNIETFKNFLTSLNLKDYLILDTNYDIFSKFAGYNSQYNIIKQKQISQLVKEFISDDMFSKRETIINLLTKSSNYENQYLAYLLYDLLSNDTNGSVDTQEQTILFDSLPWSIKQLFKQAMKKTVQYTNELSNFDINKIPLEQQICLLKANDTVKEKAMMKLKEVKAKAEDSGSKARQYLDGLLKIPFNVYKREPILNIMDAIRTKFKDIYNKYNVSKIITEIPNKEKYTSIEILKYIKIIKEYEYFNENSKTFDEIKKYLLLCDKKNLVKNIQILIQLLKKYNINYNEVNYIHLNKTQLKEEIEKVFVLCKSTNDVNLLGEIVNSFNPNLNKKTVSNNLDINSDINIINSNIKQITCYMDNVKIVLDKAVYGHDKAKKQIERIIGQWINGEQNGYCFGFEGPPGVGKTSLAKKGLSDCLKDDKGNSRPFAMIQMGGDSNGSTLHGHNYTYVGSTWGSIVQILIDKKCMNPIIFIDEVDKISRTEHGKEIVGILTHLLDPAQNDCFQDKYFTGVDLDLSKALFILSYNDVDAIDKILLDRVHRIKFNNLTIEDKLVICKTHILPEVYKKMGLENVIDFSDDVITFIIEEYTLESGVRKLKEILFEIVGEINLNVLKNNMVEYTFPIKITISDIKNNYFKDKREIIIRKVPDDSIVGFANGMYATSLGNGGTLPIHAKFFPSGIFLDLKLTGLQQDVMRESMHVSLTVAWNLTSEERKKQLRQLYDGKNNKYGINIHPGDGSVQKDGPSAGGIITVVLYSLLNDIPIKAKMAMTGEIQMSGDITAIGGLNYKILGSIKAGVREFIYPKENKKDFDEFFEKYKNTPILNDIKFYEVSHIKDALDLLLEK